MSEATGPIFLLLPVMKPEDRFTIFQLTLLVGSEVQSTRVPFPVLQTKQKKNQQKLALLNFSNQNNDGTHQLFQSLETRLNSSRPPEKSSAVCLFALSPHVLPSSGGARRRRFRGLVWRSSRFVVVHRLCSKATGSVSQELQQKARRRKAEILRNSLNQTARKSAGRRFWSCCCCCSEYERRNCWTQREM